VLTSPAVPGRFDDLATPLSAVTFAVLDLETTGTSPAVDRITEVGAVKYRTGERLGTFETLVNPGVPIPPFISVLTGITERLVLPAPGIDEVLPALLEFVGGAVIVGHNIRFDISFLDAALARRGAPPLDNPRADTLGLSRRLVHDEVDDLKLATLARHLRVGIEPCHRAQADAEATAEVFHALLERAGTFGVLALDDLLALPAVRMHPTTSKLRLTARTPRRPGVYRFRGRAGETLYVGRAANLRTEVRSHFRGSRTRVPQLLREVESIDWVECTDELEAAVREARLIHRLAPRFNRAGPTRRPAYLKLTLAEPFPRLAVVQARRDDGSLTVGPFTSAASARALRSAIEAALPIRRCTTRLGRAPARETESCCPVDGGLTRCPCRGEVTTSEYRVATDAVVRALSGDPDVVVDALTGRMGDLAAAGQLEAAAVARDQRAAVRGVLAHQHLLAWLRASGRLRVLTASGVVELHDCRLTLTDEPDDERPGTPTAPPTEVHSDVHPDELAVVARWLVRQVATGRAHVFPSGTEPLPPALADRPG
jgi:DNA polymerase-3 subunit epsilon